MNIQLFYRSKCFDSKKAERWFKERGIRLQRIDLDFMGMSRGELESVARAVGSVEALINPKAKKEDVLLLKYLDGDGARLEKLLENPALIKSPIVRNGRQATAGYYPEVWKGWE